MARRFDGRDKSALEVGGRSILDRQLAELSQVSDDILLVAAPPAADRLSTARTSRGAVRLIHDRVPGHGPLGGLDSALVAAHHDVVLLIACDMPFVTAALLDYLASLVSGVDAAVPLTERGFHPLCAAYGRACQTPVARRLAEGRLAMTGLLEEVRVRPVTGQELEAFGEPSRVLANVNTPDEYARLTKDGRELART
jgi:molybdopterin-guanine dinucleotide biosynthesis protein A